MIDSLIDLKTLFNGVVIIQTLCEACKSGSCKNE